jgi:hypothetical protein
MNYRKNIRGPPCLLLPIPTEKTIQILFTPSVLPKVARFHFKEIKMQKTVEFKTRVPETDRWEDIPVYTSKALSGTPEEIATKAEEIAEGIAFSRSSEVRWNYEGQSQGHYADEIFPDDEFIVREERILLLPAPEEIGTTVQ